MTSSTPAPEAIPDALAARLRALIDAGPPQAKRGETSAQAADRMADARRHGKEVETLRARLAAAFAEARGWQPTTAPMSAKELARRALPGGNWHRPAREWLATLFAPTFFRDEHRRACAAVAHPLAAQVEQGRDTIAAWAADHDLVATFPDFPSWHDPVRGVVVVLEPATPAAAAADRPLPNLGQRAPAPAVAFQIPGVGVTDGEDFSSPDLGSSDAAPRPMRPVAAIDLDGAVPRDLADEENPDFDVVDPTELLIDEVYQRDLTPKSLALVRNIVANWSWAKFKVPTCVRVDGRLHVIDGQHSVIAAASHPDIDAVPVLIAKLPERADHAAAFVSHATNRLPTTIVQVHRAAVQAGDEEAVTIDRVCRAAGVDLVAFPPPRSAYKSGQSIALNAIRRVVDKRGAMRARQILEPLVKAGLAPISADHIRAAEALLCDPDLSGEVDAEQIAAGMRALAAKGFAEAKTLAATKNLPLWRAMVATILKARKARPKGGRHGDAAAIEGEAA